MECQLIGCLEYFSLKKDKSLETLPFCHFQTHQSRVARNTPGNIFRVVSNASINCSFAAVNWVLVVVVVSTGSWT